MHSLYTRINTGILVFIALTGIVLVTMLATRAYGGPLDPPGAPAGTMKTLQQVEPRTPISQPASFPIQINAPGSYYLTENITGVAGVNGIVVNASNVTIDLNGFALYGSGFPSAGVIDAQQGLPQGLTIRNGTIKGWGIGVWTSKSSQSTYEDLNVSSNNTHGLSIGSGSNVRRVVAWNNNQSGLVIVQVPDAWGSIVEDSNFSRNGYRGIWVAANNVSMHGNVVHSNGESGIVVDNERGFNEIIDNSIIGNAGSGIALFPTSTGNAVARNTLIANAFEALFDGGTGNHVGLFVGDASLTGGNQYSNIVY